MRSVLSEIDFLNVNNTVSSISIVLMNVFLDGVYCTVGCRPTKCQDFEILGNPRAYLDGMILLARNHPKKIVAVGEFGLGKFT